MSSTAAEQRSDSEDEKQNPNPKDAEQQSETENPASPKRWRVIRFFKRVGFGPKYRSLPDERGKQGLDPCALERYRALDMLAATVLQTGLAAFVGGVVIALTVHSIPFRITIGLMSVFPFFCACNAGLTMLEIDHEDPEYPTFQDLRKKRSSVESSAFWLVCSILFALIAILIVLALTNKLSDAAGSEQPQGQNRIPILYKLNPKEAHRLASTPTRSTVCETSSTAPRNVHTTAIVSNGQKTIQQVAYSGLRIHRDGSCRADS